MKKILTSFILTLAAVFGLVAMTPGIYANPVNGQAEDIDGTIHNFMGGYEYLITEDLPGGQTLTPQQETYYGLYWANHFDSPQYDYDPWLGRTDEGLTVRNVEFGNEFGEIAFKGTINTDYYVVFTSQKKFTVSTFSDGVVFTSTSSRLYLRTLSFDGLRPALSGQENFAVSVDDPKPVSYFQSFLTAIDETDGDITDSIYIVNDNYTPNKAVLGTWEVTFGVQDAAGNESTLLVYITVADVTAPVITGNSTKVQISYTKTYDIAAFKSTLSITDNYDTLSNSDIVIHSDGYTSNKSNLGTYTIIFRGTDDSGNYVDFTKQVEVIDDVAPIINGPTTLTKPAASILTLAEIKSQLSATDAKDGNLTSSITVVEDNYTGNGNKVGNYTITFRVADSKGNETTHVVTVTVIDNIPPIWYIQDGVSIKIVPPATITRQQIIDILVATGQLNITSTMEINFTHDTYTGNENTPGVYMMTLAYKDTSGNEGVHTLSVTVLEDENEDPITVTPKPSFFESVGEWIGQNVLATTIIAGLLLIGVLYLVFKPKKKKYRRR